MMLPPSHPPVHEHKGNSCPLTGEYHAWCPPQPGDSRSPCPALNTLANHGYIARDGKNLGVLDLIRGLMAGYNLSLPLSILLTVGGFILMRKIRRISLYDVREHGRVEHDASLVHRDTPPGEKYAPIDIDQRLVEELLNDAKTGKEGSESPEAGEKRLLMDSSAVARARVRREKESPRLSPLFAEMARGEMAIVLGVFETKVGNDVGVPVESLREWIGHERLPAGWKPTHVEGLLNVVKRARAILTSMREQRKEEAKAKAVAHEKPKL